MRRLARTLLWYVSGSDSIDPVLLPGWVALGDFNGDGKPDIAVTEVQNGHDVGIMLNKLATTTALVSSANPAVSGEAVTIVATVTAQSPGGGIPVGKVTFKANGNDLARP
jgi:hypothetical protein